MHSDYPHRETMRARLERDRQAIDDLLADPAVDDLVWEQLPSGEWGWLRPDTDRRYVLTDQGRQVLAEEE